MVLFDITDSINYERLFKNPSFVKAMTVFLKNNMDVDVGVKQDDVNQQKFEITVEIKLSGTIVASESCDFEVNLK